MNPMPTEETQGQKYICADCGHEQDSMDRRCDDCESVRVVVKGLVETVGVDWRSTCFPRDKYPRAWEQPGWKELVSS